MHAVEQPEAEQEDEDEGGDEGAEDEDARKCDGGVAEEDCPGADEENEKFEGEADEHPITGDIAGELGALHLKHAQLGRRGVMLHGLEQGGTGKVKGRPVQNRQGISGQVRAGQGWVGRVYLWQGDHEYWTKEGGQGQEEGGGWAQVLAAPGG